MQRYLVDTPITVTVTLYVDGAVPDPAPATATVTITRDDGTVLVSAQPATADGVGGFGYSLSAAQNPQLDVLTARWTSILGTIETTIEIVGGFLFTVAQARAIAPLGNTTTYTTQAIVDARTLAESVIEEACDVAFVPRYCRETVAGTGRGTLRLSSPRVTAIRSIRLAGTAITAPELAAVVPDGPGLIYNPNGWTAGFENYEITYEHGYPEPPPRINQAALAYTKNFLVKGPIDDRTTAMSGPDGTFALLVPGLRGSVTGIPEVDAAIQQYDLTANVG